MAHMAMPCTALEPEVATRHSTLTVNRFVTLTNSIVQRTTETGTHTHKEEPIKTTRFDLIVKAVPPQFCHWVVSTELVSSLPCVVVANNSLAI